MSEHAPGERTVPLRALLTPEQTTGHAPARALTEPPVRGSHRARRVSDTATFSSSIGWTFLAALIPGLGLLKTRLRPLGVVLVTLTLGLAVALAGMAVFARNLLLSLVVRPVVLNAVWIGLLVLGVLWILGIVITQVETRPRFPSGWQRLFGAAFVGVLALAVAVPTFAGARSVYDTSNLITGVFTDDSTGAESGGEDASQFGNAVDPWANKPRLNILILGGDAGADRVGTRTDTVILASINTRTGDTVLYSLPRQTEKIPFPAGSPLAKVFPRGYYLPGQPQGEQMLNAIYDNVPSYGPAKSALPVAKDVGAKILELGVGEALGLKVDYYAMVNLDGFIELVNALGGVTLNVNVPIPVGGKNPTTPGGSDGFPPDRWLHPGPNQHFDGVDALWFARGRYQTDDYSRMSRQRCVIQAITAQVNPPNVLANYEALTKAGQNIVHTDVPNSLLPALVELATKVKGQPLRSISFENDKDGFSTTTPNWTLVRQRVQEGLDPAPAAPEPTASATGTEPSVEPSSTPSKSSKATAKAKPSATSQATTAPDGTHSIVDECAYNPNKWKPTG